jgi:hypothetical protein
MFNIINKQNHTEELHPRLGGRWRVGPLFSFAFLLFAFYFSHAQNAGARYEIDAKRNGVNPTDKDALPRGREFIRLDSTYYVGWMYTGMFKYDRSADVPGYHNCLPDLLKSFKLLEKDYKGVLANLYTNPMFFMQNNAKYNDYLVLARTLRDVYENLEVPDSSMWVLDRVDRWGFKRDFLGVNQFRAWTVHRNRFFTHAKYDWLGNSVEENEKLALQHCYDAISSINRNRAAVEQWWGPGTDQQDKQFVYHYLALLKCYVKDYDSSQYYYDKLKEGGYISWNNYGGFQSEIGEFKQSQENFEKDMYKYGDQKFLREPFYYIPTLRIYAGDPKKSIELANEAIEASNTTPGFGWYNLALARGYLYDGQLDSADLTITKAQEFKEIHIGTTLTQQQYEFTTGLLRLVWYNMKIEQVKFLDKSWWYSPKALYQLAELTVNKYMHQYLMATKLATNPERERLIYELFCAEGTTTWDEAWYLLKDFSRNFFIKKMENYATTDKRANIIRYFRLFENELAWRDGDKKKARAGYEELLNKTLLDTAQEKLFLARTYEGLAKAYKDNDEQERSDLYTNLLYERYPQLIPFSGLAPKVKLTVTGDDDEVTKDAVDELKDADIRFVDGADENTIIATVSFQKIGIKYQAIVNARSANNIQKVSRQIFFFKDAKGAGKELAKRIFGSGGALEIELPKEDAQKQQPQV